MKLLGYGIKDGKDTFIVERGSIEEKGTFTGQYILGRDPSTKEMLFGFSNDIKALIRVTEKNKPDILTFLEKSIKESSVESCYIYKDTTEPEGRGGFVTEIVPPMCKKIPLDEQSVDAMKNMCNFLKT